MPMTDGRHHILIVIAGIAAGTGTFCKSLGAGLRKYFGDELKVSLLTFRGDANLPENAVNFDESHILQSAVRADWKRAIDLPRGFLRLRKAVNEISPDLIFTIGTFSNVVTSLAIDSVPVVMSDHLNMTQRLSGARFGGVTGWFMRRAYPRRLMVVAADELARDLQQNFAAKRVKVIPNGIDAEVVRRRADEPPAVELPESYLVSVGRLTAQKDVSTMLRGFALARQQATRSDLLIVGDGEERTMLESLASELGIASSVRFLGHQSNPYPLIKRSRGLILSSIWEGFAYVPIEAMALGVPVISTACPSGPAEILGGGEFGLLVPPRDPSELAKAILRLENEPGLHERLSRKSLERADQLSVENMARAYRDLFLQELKREA